MRWTVKRMVIVAAAVVATLVAGTTGAYAQLIIPPGTDCFETTDNSTWVEFGGTGMGAVPPIPAGFFGPGSDPFDGIIALKGEPLLGYPGQVSTLIERLEFAELMPSATIAIEMVELNLVSVEPIIVTYDGGTVDSFFDVFVTLSDIGPSTGYMTITETTPGAGYYEFNSFSGGGIYIHPKFVFTRVDPPHEVFELELPEYDMMLENDAAYPAPLWQSVMPEIVCFDDQLFYPVPGEEVFGLLNEGDAGAHGVIPPRDWTGCCFPGGLCVDMDSLDCQMQGGVPQGQFCTGTVEACCLPDGGCLMIDPLCCDEEGGVVVIGGICAGWTEACCDSFLPYGCMDADPTCCEPALGGWLPGEPFCQGDGNGNLIDDACETQEEGACCYGAEFESCTVTTQDDCEINLMGVYQGDGTMCEGMEACCLPDGTCVDADALCCRNELGGIPAGAATLCAGLTVACCFDDGSCMDVDAACCEVLGGWPSPFGEPICLGDGNGNGTDDACELVQEDQACCLPDGSCVDVTHNDCVDMGGDPQGPGTVCTAAMCTPLKWSQPPTFNPDSLYPDCFWGWDELSEYFGPQIVADDWLCDDPRPITDIHWWGSYQRWNGDMPPNIVPDQFHIGIWTDVPVGIDPFSHPGMMIWEWMVDLADLNERSVGCDFHPGFMDEIDTCFRYDFIIPESEWFYQEEPSTIYWVSISALYLSTPDYQWGWKTREHFYNDDAVRIFFPTNPVPGDEYYEGEPIEYPPGTSWDMAFVLTTIDLQPTCYCRDVNCDGFIDSLDLGAVKNPANWLLPVPPAANPLADVDRNGIVDALDLGAIKNPIYWMTNPHPGGCTCSNYTPDYTIDCPME